MKSLLPSLTTFIAFGMIATSPPILAQTPFACEEESGAAYGLCNAYRLLSVLASPIRKSLKSQTPRHRLQNFGASMKPLVAVPLHKPFSQLSASRLTHLKTGKLQPLIIIMGIV